MTDQLEQELRDMLTERSGDAGNPSFGGEAMVVRGRAARRRRHAMAMAGTAAAVIVAILVSGSLLRPSHEVLPAGRTPTPTGWPLPDDFAKALAALPRGEKLRHELLIGDEIVRPDGDRIPIGLPKGFVPSEVSRVPGGWVVEASQDPQGFSLWFRPESGSVRQLVDTVRGHYVISQDGTRIVAAGDSRGGVTLRELPSGRELSRTTYEAGMGPLVRAIIGDKVILAGAQGSGGARDVAIWDVPAKKVTRLAEPEMSIADLTPDGSTIVSRVPGGDSCVGIGGLANLVTMGGIRLCGTDGQILGENVSLSPGADHVLVGPNEARPQQRLGFGDMSAVRRGDGLPVLNIGLPDSWQLEARALAWESERMVLVQMPVPPQGDAVVILRCEVNGRTCESVPLPGNSVGYDAVIPSYGS